MFQYGISGLGDKTFTGGFVGRMHRTVFSALTNESAAVNVDDLVDYCRQRLGGMKTPKSFEFWEELPRSAVGKVLKRSIRDRFWIGQKRNV